MQTLNLPAIRVLRPAWNKGCIVGQKLPLKPKHVWAIRVQLELAENHRDLARMKVVNVMASVQIKERASVLQSKTQKPVWFEISEGNLRSEAWQSMSNQPPLACPMYGARDTPFKYCHFSHSQ
ncbi:MAG: hypothetical protein ACI8TF_003135 [Paracoccaceae bacterium]|jgi:hypothetical protein